MNVNQALSQMRIAEHSWRTALEQHELAPPDENYFRRLSDFADACEQQEIAFASLASARLAFQPFAEDEFLEFPYEITPDCPSRPGPPQLWATFDQRLEDLNKAFHGISPAAISRVYGDLSKLARELSQAVDAERAGITTKRRQQRPA